MACCFGRRQASDDEKDDAPEQKVGVKGPSGPGSTEWKEDEWKGASRAAVDCVVFACGHCARLSLQFCVALPSYVLPF